MSDSLITKKALASSLKNLMKQKSFDKITISDITKSCGLNRQTFYYHFQDKIDLLSWIFKQEVISVLTDGLNIDNWQGNTYRMIRVMEENRGFYQLAMSIQNEFSQYLLEIATELSCKIIEELSGDQQLKEDTKRFIAEFYAYGVVGIILAWAKGGMKRSADDMIKYLSTLVEHSKAFAVRRYFDTLNI